MIRKYARIDAEPQTLRDLFRDVKNWPSWMPSIESVQVLERSDDRALVAVRQRLVGRVSTQKLELQFDAQGHTETQISGRLKRWQTVWRFVEPPTGQRHGGFDTVDIALGAARFFVPRAWCSG